MAEASETPTVRGHTVAVGDHNNITVVQNNIPQLPQSLPPGTRVHVSYDIVVGAESGAASSAAEEQEQSTPHQQGTGHQRSSADQQAGPTRPVGQGHRNQTDRKRLTRQASVPNTVQGDPDIGQEQPSFVQPANTDGLPYTLYPTGDPGPGPAAMTPARQPACRTVSTPIQETHSHGPNPPVTRANTFPKLDTDVKTAYNRADSMGSQPYSLSPQDCPHQGNTHEPVPCRPLPKPTTSPATLTSINTRTAHDAATPELTDILVMIVQDVQVALVLDMVNKNIKSVSLADSAVRTLNLKGTPISLAALDQQKVIVSFLDMKTLSIIDVSTMVEVRTLQTPRLYCGVAVLDNGRIAACCQDNQSVEIISVQGQVFDTFRLRSTQHPSAIAASSTITVSDWRSNTLVCLSPQGQEQSSVRLCDKGNSTLRGVAHHGSSTFVADEGGNRVLRLDSCDISVSVVLNSGDTVTRPCGLCVNNNVLYIAQGDGVIKYWEIPYVAAFNTRM
ncbi:uncharacterized protein LOC124149703 [Haliotis rufescens]|uniref:uncharacterized protein LOC124149703 n=1 Tax=Haliotis rufescens TaxID=6454 RepID=UPI00201F308E|nr:uncharacterized protein LOC124149703 [Haliotis rufescens]